MEEAQNRQEPWKYEFIYHPGDRSFQVALNPECVAPKTPTGTPFEASDTAVEVTALPGRVAVQGLFTEFRSIRDSGYPTAVISLGKREEAQQTASALERTTGAFSYYEAPIADSQAVSEQLLRLYHIGYRNHDNAIGGGYGQGGFAVVIKDALQGWLTEQPREVFERAADEMTEVYEALNRTLAEAVDMDGLAMEDADIDVRAYTQVDMFSDQLAMTVLGNCACLGVNPHGYRARQYRDDAYELDTHNIDTPAQLMSLLAGLGALSRMALEDTSRS